MTRTLYTRALSNSPCAPTPQLQDPRIPCLAQRRKLSLFPKVLSMFLRHQECRKVEAKKVIRPIGRESAQVIWEKYVITYFFRVASGQASCCSSGGRNVGKRPRKVRRGGGGRYCGRLGGSLSLNHFSVHFLMVVVHKIHLNVIRQQHTCVYTIRMPESDGNGMGLRFFLFHLAPSSVGWLVGWSVGRPVGLACFSIFHFSVFLQTSIQSIIGQTGA